MVEFMILLFSSLFFNFEHYCCTAVYSLAGTVHTRPLVHTSMRYQVPGTCKAVMNHRCQCSLQTYTSYSCTHRPPDENCRVLLGIELNLQTHSERQVYVALIRQNKQQGERRTKLQRHPLLFLPAQQREGKSNTDDMMI